jgi:CubicO group peptidase (beta-lactamase class C family)
MSSSISRRSFLQLSMQVALATGVAGAVASQTRAATGPANDRFRDAFRAVDEFAVQYLREMNAPGMTLVVADLHGPLHSSTFGYSDLVRSEPVRPEQLFHIGSISKSFVAIALLQLREEGKLDLHRPIVEYLPWLRIESQYAPITTHHLLNHTSGLPGNAQVFLSDPRASHRAAYAPGEHYYYSNLAYDILGRLIRTLDGTSLAESLGRRILSPLAMTMSDPVIGGDTRSRTVRSYVPYHGERPYPRFGPLAEATDLLTDAGAGSIAATGDDMGRYLAMLANRGKGPRTRLLSEESFELMTTPWIEAPDFGPDASYGYGIAIDRVDGHAVLRHTGGMVSFMSAMQIDLDEGIGAFASINAMQEYRPNAVVAYAIKAVPAAAQGRAVPPLPPPTPPTRIENAAVYAGVYKSAHGRVLEFEADGERLYLLYDGQRVPVEVASVPGFLARHPDFDAFVLTFGRASGEDGPVTEVTYGPDWFANDRYIGPREFVSPAEWSACTGHYRNDSPWLSSLRVFVRRGRLWAALGSGYELPLAPDAGRRFRLVDPPYAPDWIEFLDVVDERSMHLKASGDDFWRLEIA